MRARRAITFVTMVCGLAIRAEAQEIRGTVRDSASGQPIPAAVLLLLDSTGATLGRNITDERGRYRIARSPTMRRLRIFRIGFRPREAAIPGPVTGIATLDVAMQSLPTMLEPVRITDSTTCPMRADRAAALALWEQARTGLLATIVARTAQPVAMARLLFDRLLERNGNDIAYQRVRIDSSSANTSFNAAHTAGDFVKNGFMEGMDDGDQLFFGPDADVLIDDAFAHGYCFELTSPPRDRPRAQLGLSFKAAEPRKGRIDIDGTLWIDTAQRAIRDIEFRYVGLDRALEALRPGGHVSFHEATNGIVFVDRWALRLIGAAPMPLPAGFPPIADAAVGRSPSGENVFLQEVGGEVARASWPDGTTWTASLGTFNGTLLHGDVPVGSGVLVRLRETNYSTHTDSAGHFEIPGLLPGPYEVDLMEPTFEKFDLVQDSMWIVAARDSVVGGRTPMASMDDYIRAVCPRRAGVVPRNILVVRALDARMRRVRDLRLSLSSAPTRSGPWSYVIGRVALTDAYGQLIVCETSTRKPLPTTGVFRLRSIDPKFDSQVLDVEIEPGARLLTVLMPVTAKP